MITFGIWFLSQGDLELDEEMFGMGGGLGGDNSTAAAASINGSALVNVVMPPRPVEEGLPNNADEFV